MNDVIILGADVNSKDVDGDRPLHIVMIGGSMSGGPLVSYLMKGLYPFTN